LLKKKFPDATDAEITRFAVAYGSFRGRLERRKRAAAARLEAYLDWRKQFELDKEEPGTRDLPDTDIWDHAVSKAWDFALAHQEATELGKKLEEEAKLNPEKEVDPTDYEKAIEEAMKELPESSEEVAEDKEEDDGEASEPASTMKRSKIDQVIFFHKLEGESIRDKNGHMIAHVIPARIDRSVASASVYANAFAFYLDLILPRNSDEKVTILFDVRGGEGFPNPSPRTMLMFINTVSRLLEFNFPERLENFIVFPVPMLARGVMQPIKLLMEGRTVSKLELLSGPADRHAPLPRKSLENFIDAKVLDKTEAVRLGCFKIIGN